jgi:hypothetical protein
VHFKLLLTAFSLVLIFVVAGGNHYVSASQSLQQAPFTIVGPTSPVAVTLSQTGPTTIVVSGITLFNRSDTPQTFNLSMVDLPDGWESTISPGDVVTVPANSFVPISVRLVIPRGTAPGVLSLTIVATRQGTGEQATAFIVLNMNFGTPTTTPASGAGGCPDNPDPGNSFDGAQLIRVDFEELHGICEIGDEDWFKFPGVENKVYTIDIPQMDNGLDLSLELYDENGALLTSNDDYFNRDPSKPEPKDKKPRIQSYRVPRNGLYYVRVRDTLNVGGDSLSYRILISGESYGPTPQTIAEVCADLYEPDGLPEISKLILSNETHKEHRFCPEGDADWVKFFGLTGYVYYMYTNTTPYANTPDGLEAGADTIIYLFDRDGVSQIATNNNIPGLPTLDSQIRFVPQADGFYYLQIKNVGDAGTQFIKYDVTLKACVPGSECGRLPEGGTGGTTPSPASTPAAASGPTSTPVAAAAPTSTPVAAAAPTSRPAPGDEEVVFGAATPTTGPSRGFADVAFELTWLRNDAPLAQQRVSRSWMWGPLGLAARNETYAQSPFGTRLVQYFDKGRMEINDPNSNRQSRWFVTSGLLVSEMVEGRFQVGETQYVALAPAALPIAGDANDPDAPTYATFGKLPTQASQSRIGEQIAEQLSRVGELTRYAGPERSQARVAAYIRETGHNVPQVFWEYLNREGQVFVDGRYYNDRLIDWIYHVGYPISEPYWIKARIGGVQRDVLVQLFQRRVLTYTPDAPPNWQVEMGNVGQHYYRWRYNADLPPQ